jgi:MFS family permease
MLFLPRRTSGGSKVMTTDAHVARRITATLFVAQSLVSAAFIASGTVSAIVAAQLSGDPAWAGVPASMMQLGAAVAALGVAAASDRIGRRWALALGLAAGVAGTGLGAGAIGAEAFLLFLAASVLLGVAAAAMKLGRFAAAEVHPPQRRGRAISQVVLGGAVGSVAGPLLIAPSGRWMEQAGRAELAGPYLAALVVLAVAALVIYLWLRPDPRDVGRDIARRVPEGVGRTGLPRPLSHILRTPSAVVAVAAMVLSQMVMTLLMGMTSLHMMDYQHALASISVVVSAHTFGMYVFSLVAGHLTDRWGRGPVIGVGSVILVLACGLAILSADMLPLSLALFLLGVGWSFCYVGGSALLFDPLSPDERAKTQGTNDFLISLATAGASAGSGLLFASTSYTVLGITGAVASLVPLGLTAWWMARQRRPAVACC